MCFFWEMNTCLAVFSEATFENYHGVHSATTNLCGENRFNSIDGQHFLHFFPLISTRLRLTDIMALRKYIWRCACHCWLNIKITYDDAIKQYFHNLPVIRPHSDAAVCGVLVSQSTVQPYEKCRNKPLASGYSKFRRIIERSKIRSWAQPSKILLAINIFPANKCTICSRLAFG